ncbi:MerR family transcriptional regulator [Anoxybacterium hadale]|uniref:MerR family transcriptional regulator n=1 Tax=Anoxybacterium hadale TaxID=3408580 RepID=A0ACD1AD31_9FIRM|nr:MerR family transcriptional regulator [Clostridiales bacterium]
MFKIGEFSKLMQVSVRMLRYYDEAGLLKPAEIDRFTGYRFYSTAQIQQLQRIIFLRDSGFAVGEISALLKRCDDNYTLSALDQKREEAQIAIDEQRKKISKIEAAICELREGRQPIHYEVLVKRIPAYPTLCLRRIIPNYFHEGMLWKEFTEQVEREKLEVPQNTLNFAVYHDLEYKETDVDVEVCAVVNETEPYLSSPMFRMVEEVSTMACMMVYGPFENIGPAFAEFARWLSEHQTYRMSGFNRQICHRGPWNEEVEDHYLTEIQIPVEIRD